MPQNAAKVLISPLCTSTTKPTISSTPVNATGKIDSTDEPGSSTVPNDATTSDPTISTTTIEGTSTIDLSDAPSRNTMIKKATNTKCRGKKRKSGKKADDRGHEGQIPTVATKPPLGEAERAATLKLYTGFKVRSSLMAQRQFKAARSIQHIVRGYLARLVSKRLKLLELDMMNRSAVITQKIFRSQHCLSQYTTMETGMVRLQSLARS